MGSCTLQDLLFLFSYVFNAWGYELDACSNNGSVIYSYVLFHCPLAHEGHLVLRNEEAVHFLCLGNENTTVVGLCDIGSFERIIPGRVTVAWFAPVSI